MDIPNVLESPSNKKISLFAIELPDPEFKLDPEFILSFKNEKVDWGPVGYIVYKRCVDEHTPVLCADLRWRPSGELKVGDEIIAFDSDPGVRNLRHLKTTKVLHNKIEVAETYGIELEDGTILYSTPDHEWLVQMASSSLVWRETKDLGKSNKGGPVFLCRPFGPVWTDDTSYEAGYLAAAFDGEGCVDRVNSISFVQVQNSMIDKVESFLDRRCIPYTRSSRKLIDGRQQCYSLRINGRRNFIPLLGSIQAPRLIDRLRKNMYKDGGALRTDPEDLVKVVRVFPAGSRNIAVLSTDAETHFTGGFASHNTYARTKEDGHSEEWYETIARVVDGVYQIQQRHCVNNHVQWKASKAQRSAQEMYRRIFNFSFLPPGRGLWMMGTEFIKYKGGTALNNCSFTTTANIDKDFSEPFCWLMDMSMLGVGVGADTVGAKTISISQPIESDVEFIIPDSREGWILAVRYLLDSYVGKSERYPYSYADIRPYGSPIKGFGGVASGHVSLQQLLEIDIPSVLDPLIGKVITSTAIVDIFNFIGKCVVSGNVRRSAEIMFGDPEDDDFLNLKNSDLHPFEIQDRRWASNNSLKVKLGMDYSEVAKKTALNGEPGYFWLDNARKFGRMSEAANNKDSRVLGGNPCLEISLENKELCCLVETFPARHSSYEDYERTLKFAYLYAKTVTLVPTHCKKTNEVVSRNRRIGTSQSGIVQNFAKVGRRTHFKWCDDGYKYINELDRIYSEWLAVRESIKKTTVKPSGSVSKLCGATSGLHYPPAEYYIQRIRFAVGSALLELLKEARYPIEPCVYTPNTMVVEFPSFTEGFTKSESEVSLWEQLSNAVQMQRWWSDNQVSCTVKFDGSDPVKAAAEIKSALELFEDQLKGISFLPHDHGYAQAPWEPITKEEYEKRISTILPLEILEQASNEVIEKFCDGDKCQI